MEITSNEHTLGEMRKHNSQFYPFSLNGAQDCVHQLFLDYDASVIFFFQYIL